MITIINSSTQNIYAIPAVLLVHVIGQLIDAYLFLYLIHSHFMPRKNQFSSHRHILCMTAVFAALFFLVDLLSHNNFWTYYASILLIPLVYSLLLFHGKPLDKILLSSVFTMLILSFEQFSIALTHPFIYDQEVPLAVFLLTFSLRRIWLKLLLYFVIHRFLFWPENITPMYPAPLMALFLCFSTFGNFMLVSIHTLLSAISFWIYIGISLFLALTPIMLLILMRYFTLSTEHFKIMSAQLYQERVQNQYLRQQQEMIDALKKFRHDYKSHLFCMDALLEEGKYEELHQYLLSLHQQQYEGIQIRNFVDNSSLNILLNQKITLAEKYGIQFDTNIVLNDSGKVAISDFISLLANLCDNAIEACATLPDSKISLDIHHTKAYLIIQMTNTTGSNIREHNPDLHTTKSNPALHGTGIKIIRSIAEKYNGQYDFSSTDHSFTVKLMLLDNP